MPANDLTVLCVTENTTQVQHLLDRMAADASRIGALHLLLIDGEDIECNGLMEHAQDYAVDLCRTRYILILADDEALPERTVQWLEAGSYRDADNWCFPRVHLADGDLFYPESPLYPDLQTRLATKEKSGGRSQVHQGSPYGTGRVAPVAIEHHKFLVHDRAARQAILDRYEGLGADERFRVFSLPEDFDLRTAPYDPAVTP